MIEMNNYIKKTFDNYPSTTGPNLTNIYRPAGQIEKQPELGNSHPTTRIFGGPGIEYIDTESGQRVVSCIPLHGKQFTPVGNVPKSQWKIE